MVTTGQDGAPGAYDVPDSVHEATTLSVESAKHLTKLDAGAIATLLKLAGQIDYLIEHDGLNAEGKFDNVSVPTYLKYAESLGLTPAARARIEGKPTPKPQPAKTGLTGLQGGVGGRK